MVLFLMEEQCSINGGFCVTGYNEDGNYTEGDDIVTDSHTLAWYVDAAMAMFAAGLVVMHEFTNAEVPALFGTPFCPKPEIIVLSLALIIGHGILHGFVLAENYNPVRPRSDGIVPKDTASHENSDVPSNDTIGFILFSAVISFAVFELGSNLPAMICNSKIIPDELSSVAHAVVIAASTGVLSHLSIHAANSGLAPITVYFASTQLLVTSVALLIPNEAFADPIMGWTFAFTCVVSLVEQRLCECYFRKLGGHAWYDFALHASLLVGLWADPSSVQ